MSKELEALYKRLQDKDWTYMCAIDKQLIMKTVKEKILQILDKE